MSVKTDGFKTKVPEPVWTAVNMNRKAGDTTFDTCGWCKHRSGGLMRYDAMLEGRCSLLRQYGPEVTWSTPCLIKPMGAADLESEIRSKGYEQSEYEGSIKRVKAEIGTLKMLAKKAEKKPPLPDHRGDDPFPLGSIVWVMYERKWSRGKVVSGYRSGDGCVSYVLDDYPESAGGWGCGWSIPGVILDWEFQYFLKHPDAYEDWLRSSDRKYNGESLPMADFREAFSKALSHSERSEAPERSEDPTKTGTEGENV